MPPPPQDNTDFSPGNALIAMSGGVDSSVAAALMLDKGCPCEGLTLKLCGNDAEKSALNDAQNVAQKLGMPHHVLDFTEFFRKEVILPFIETYEKGATPNPCIYCNHHIKFAFPLFRALKFDIYATGHYAQTEKQGSRWFLKKAADHKKDQSYVLFTLDQETLSRTCFPLGSLTKNEVREIAESRGFINANRKDSQDICFVPDGNYGTFIEQYTGKTYPPGDITDPAGKIIGRHNGHIRYTLGQRRGLGVAMNEPVYVCSKNTLQNTITLGPESSLYSKNLSAHAINLIACKTLEKGIRATVKTRYLQKEHSAWVLQTGPDEIKVEFDEPQRAITPGQAAVFYDGDIVVGGGIITGG